MADVETETHSTEPGDSGMGDRMQGIHSAAHEGVALIRDVATDTVRAAGDVGIAAVDTTRHLLVGVADGVRDVLAHIVPFAVLGGRGGSEPRREP